MNGCPLVSTNNINKNTKFVTVIAVGNLIHIVVSEVVVLITGLFLVREKLLLWALEVR